MHWKVRGKWSWGTTFCGGSDSAKGCKGGRKRCCEGITTIHRSAVESTIRHKGANNDRSITKGNGNVVVWSKSGNEKKTCNPR